MTKYFGFALGCLAMALAFDVTSADACPFFRHRRCGGSQSTSTSAGSSVKSVDGILKEIDKISADIAKPLTQLPETPPDIQKLLSGKGN